MQWQRLEPVLAAMVDDGPAPAAPDPDPEAAPRCPVQANPRPIQLPMPRQVRFSILLVDDDPTALQARAALLAPEYEVLTADGAPAALDLLSRRGVDIVLTAQRQPRHSGVQLLEWVREHQPRTVRLLMSRLTDLDEAIAAVSRGHAYSYLVEPCRADDLLHVVHNAAEKCQLESNQDQLLEELRQLNRELERRVAERTRELEQVNLLLQQRAHELERLALTDPLTGLFNRRAMDELLRFELKRHARYPSPLTVALIDVDHFKDVNTRYLLTGGDEVLRGLARVLVGSVREVDSVGRIGGEEFLVIARETDEDGARTLAERIRATVETTPITYERQAITVTVSLGVAVADVDVPATQQGLLEAAAAALARAKVSGRNRVIVRPLPQAL
jgi:diguanylate cyclase (GGDEF)-like protein